jgi:hypothetical protein
MWHFAGRRVKTLNLFLILKTGDVKSWTHFVMVSAVEKLATTAKSLVVA